MVIAVVTSSQADYGLLERFITLVENDPEVELKLFVTGSHVCPEFGLSIQKIKHPITERVEVLLSSDTNGGMAKAIGLGCILFSQVFERHSPHWLVVLGDRFEIFASSVAAFSLKIPVVHISGGEKTIGSSDDVFRHMITKMANIHLVYHDKYAKRVIQLGEDPSRVFNVGWLPAEGLENYKSSDSKNGYLISYHPETVHERIWVFGELMQLLATLSHIKEEKTFCLSKGDPNSRMINQQLSDGFKVREYTRDDFLKKLATSRAIIGNSSAGICEAPAVGTPTINIGKRQKGRLMASSVINCENMSEVPSAIKMLNQVDFSYIPYNGENVSEKMLEVIKTTNPKNKEFYDLCRSNTWWWDRPYNRRPS